ncbi:MAG: holo-ACP synthase [Armatimonadetes bacterium]|nr:holo-ACP synthase [Armatimonadota bacterium]
MILGVGTDICSVKRMQYMTEKYGARFLDRVFTPEEQERARRKAGWAERLAARFAAKEATMKALGTGWACGVRFLDIHVTNEFGGRPVVRLVGTAATWAESIGVTRIHVSLSHEREQAVAFVVLEAADGRPWTD